MKFGEDENFDDSSAERESRERIIKQKILDENYKKAELSIGLKRGKKTFDIKSKKKPFSYLGIFLIIAAVVCLIITEQIPWFYVKYDINNNENMTTIEESYYKDFVNKNGNNYNQIRNLFEPINRSYLIGLSIDDFVATSILSYYSFLMLIFLGFFFTVFVVLYRVFKYSYETMIIIQSFFAATSAVVCVFLLFIFVKFIAAHVLFYYNTSMIHQILLNASISFPVPVIVIIIVSFILKICFVIVKSGYRELERMTTYSTKETGFTYKIHG